MFTGRNLRGPHTMDVRDAEKEQDDFFDKYDGHWTKERAPKAFGIEDEDKLGNKEFENILKKCMQKLPALWAAVFTMKHIEEQPSDMICTELSVTSSNFWVIVHRTKLNLRDCLQKHWI